jgi:hypothetical protein
LQEMQLFQMKRPAAATVQTELQQHRLCASGLPARLLLSCVALCQLYTENTENIDSQNTRAH